MASLFRPALDLMAQYAAYHRDRRNIATHFVGIPLIVFAISVLMARAEFDIAGTPMNAAIVLWGVTALWYLTRGNIVLGAATAIVNGVLTALAMTVAQASMTSWLVIGVGSFVVGWIFQFIGHYYEGRKPAFVDDLVGLLVGPMFVVGEAMFMLGWGRPLLAEIEKRVGPTHLRDLAHPV
ncbi:MAG TPA: Mpo1-like protein [Roseateles sp.]